MKYKFKTDKKSPNICIEQCPIQDIKIGSVACAECRHNKHYDPIYYKVECSYLSDNGCGYKIVGDFGATNVSHGIKLDARHALGKPIQPLCFMSRC
jgi:hypothetical protein